MQKALCSGLFLFLSALAFLLQIDKTKKNNSLFSVHEILSGYNVSFLGERAAISLSGGILKERKACGFAKEA